MSARVRRPAGFTLVEILVALAIFSTLLLLLVSAFTGAARTRDRLNERYARSRQSAMLVDRLGTDLFGAVSATRIPETQLSSKEDTFSGQPGATLAFTAFTVASDADERLSSGLVKIRYYPKVSSDPGFLDLYREQSDLALVENRLPVRESRVARRIRGFRVECYDGSAWRTDWPPSDKPGALPPKVAFTLTDETGETLRREVPLAFAGQESQILFSGKRPKP